MNVYNGTQLSDIDTIKIKPDVKLYPNKTLVFVKYPNKNAWFLCKAFLVVLKLTSTNTNNIKLVSIYIQTTFFIDKGMKLSEPIFKLQHFSNILTKT